MPKSLPFVWGSRTYVMGILNITPDSFSGDGLLDASRDRVEDGFRGHITSAVKQARKFIAAGVDILDVGGESTRPGAQYIKVAEELRRVIPVIRALVEETDIPISIDTYKARVAEAAIQAGVRMVNDIWGLKADPEMASVVANHEVAVVLMHNRLRPASRKIQKRLGNYRLGAQYDNLIEDVKRELMESVSLARNAGIPDENIIFDPGIGFGKSPPQSLELLNRLDEIRALGFPLMIGPSRKAFIGRTLGLPQDQNREGTSAAIAIGIDRGADIVRVHDVEEMVRVARMTDAIVRNAGK